MLGARRQRAPAERAAGLSVRGSIERIPDAVEVEAVAAAQRDSRSAAVAGWLELLEADAAVALLLLLAAVSHPRRRRLSDFPAAALTPPR